MTEAIHFQFKVEIASKSDMRWHPHAEVKRAERKQGIKLRYADELFVLTTDEAHKLADDLLSALK